MTPGVELELKLTLAGAADYEALRQGLGAPRVELEQHNRFFDTALGSLSRRRWSLRVRRETDADRARVVVTVKGPSTRLGGAVHRAEEEAEADEALWQSLDRGPLSAEAFPAPIRTLLAEKAPLEGPLTQVITFTNHRTCYRVDLAGAPRTIELDCTRFGTGEVDHELELELAPPPDASEAELRLEVTVVERALTDLLQELRISTTRSRKGKYSRARAYAGLR